MSFNNHNHIYSYKYDQNYKNCLLNYNLYIKSQSSSIHIRADEAEQKSKVVAKQVGQIAAPVINLPKNEEEKLCEICMERYINAVAVPCGHLRYCFVCIQQINDCAICRKPIEQKVKVY